MSELKAIVCVCVLSVCVECVCVCVCVCVSVCVCVCSLGSPLSGPLYRLATLTCLQNTIRRVFMELGPVTHTSRVARSLSVVSSEGSLFYATQESQNNHYIYLSLTVCSFYRL